MTLNGIRILATTIGWLTLGVSAPAASQTFDELGTALSCGTVGAAGVTSPGNRLFRVDIPLSDYPDAICNDGSPGVFYVVASPGGADAAKWNIHLQGGGACRTPEDCVKRWCSVDSNFGMDKMSSDHAPLFGVSGNGILSPRPDNPLRGWNHVFMHYCSSDNWSGQASDVQVTAQSPGGTSSVDVRIHFRGAAILDAAIDMLRRANGLPVSYFDGTAIQSMPNLDDAERVILSGASAGGGGVTRNLDRLAETLPQTNQYCGSACDDLVRGVIDAAFAPDRTPLDHSQTTKCIEEGLCSHTDFSRVDWDDAMLGMWNLRTDQSCRDWHQANQPADEWRCADHTWLIRHHVTTPFFLRFDLQDSLISRNMASTIDPVTGERRGAKWHGAWTDPKIFAVLAWEQMKAVRNNWKTALEGHGARGKPSVRPPGVFAPQCNQHETLRNNPGYFAVTAPDADGVSRTMPELLANWLDGIEPQVAIETPLGIGPQAHCP